MLVARVRLPACKFISESGAPVLQQCSNSLWESKPSAAFYNAHARTRYRSTIAELRNCRCQRKCRKHGSPHVSMPRELKSRPGTTPTHSGCGGALGCNVHHRMCRPSCERGCEIDSEGIRTLAGRARLSITLPTRPHCLRITALCMCILAVSGLRLVGGLRASLNCTSCRMFEVSMAEL